MNQFKRAQNYRLWGTFILPVLFLLGVENFAAARYHLIPAVLLKEEYNTNIFIDRTETADYMTTISPKLTVSNAEPTQELSLRCALDALYYNEHSEKDDIDYRFAGHYSRSISPRLRVTTDLNYHLDHRPDRDLTETGLPLGTDLRKVLDTRLTAQYDLTERTSSSISYAYGRENFEQQIHSEYQSHTAIIGVSRDISDVLIMSRFLINLGAAHYDYLNSRSNIQKAFVTLGLNHNIAESLQIQYELGPRITETSFQILPYAPPIETRDKGLTGKILVIHNKERTTTRLVLSHDTHTFSGTQGTTDRTSLTLYHTLRLTEKLTGYAHLGYFLNQTTPPTATSIEEKTIRSSLTAKYRLTRDLAFECGYVYTDLQESDVRQHQGNIQLTYRHDLFNHP